jgi:Bifunctional DNA primase/polymerase, N-terminal
MAAAGTAVPTVVGPGAADKPTTDDGGAGQRQPERGLQSSGPLVRTGGGGWHYYLAPTGLGNAHFRGLEQVDWRGRGGYVIAPPSRHASGQAYQWAPGRDLGTPPGQVPTVLARRWRSGRPQQRRVSG